MALHIRSHRAPCSCFPKKVSLQLSSEQSVGDVRDWKGGAVKLGVEYEAKVSSRVNGVE